MALEGGRQKLDDGPVIEVEGVRPVAENLEGVEHRVDFGFLARNHDRSAENYNYGQIIWVIPNLEGKEEIDKADGRTWTYLLGMKQPAMPSPIESSSGTKKGIFSEGSFFSWSQTKAPTKNSQIRKGVKKNFSKICE